MSLKSVITSRVVSETLSKVVSLLSSASLNLSADQIKNLVMAKVNAKEVTFADNNDIGYCVSRLMQDCAYVGISSVEDLEAKYSTLREQNDLVTETVDMMAEGLATLISPILYELREVIPAETSALAAAINDQIPSIESLREKTEGVKVFNWGKLQNPTFLQATIAIAQDKASCFKDGVPRQHDAANILRRVPYNTVEVLQGGPELRTALAAIFTADIEKNYTDTALKLQMKSYIESAVGLVSNDRLYTRTLNDLKASLSATALSTNIVSVIEKVDGVEDILRMLSIQSLNTNESLSALAPKIFANIETVLTNLALIRASTIFHKIHTLQNKLILSKNAVQESALETFHSCGGTDQMIKDHLAYMELNELVVLPTNGLSTDVVLNSTAKAKATVQKNAEKISGRIAANRVRNLQDAVHYSLQIHYKKYLDAGIYRPQLEAIHERQLNASIGTILHKPVEDIALEYLVALQNNRTMTSFFEAIRSQLVSLVKNQTDINPGMIQEATCSGVVSVIYDSLVKDFAKQKEAA